MTDEISKPRRVVSVRRTLALGTLAAAVAGTATQAAPVLPLDSDTPDRVLMAAGEGEGEGEGEGAGLDTVTGLLRDLGVLQGRLRAGLALYQSGDTDAATAHFATPAGDIFRAGATPPAGRGLVALKDQLSALSDAAAAGKPPAEIAALYDTAAATIDAARGQAAPAQRLGGLIALTRAAGEAYSAGTAGGTVADLPAYQASWGMLDVVRTRLNALRDGDDAALAGAAEAMLSALSATDAVFGDIRGGGDFRIDPGVIFGAAARMDFAAVKLK